MAQFEISNKPRHDPLAMGADDDEIELEQVHPLRSEAALTRLRQYQEWRYEARLAHAENRMEQAIDADYYDGDQWTLDEIAELEERGQAPLVYNVLAQHINWLLGTERRTKVEWAVHPRSDDDVDLATIKTKVLKYISDVSRAPFLRSRAFADAIKVGVGWLEDGARNAPGEEPLFSRCESWRRVWWDPLSRENDLSDARYLFRERWVDLDVAVAMFPDRKAELEASAELSNLLSDQDEDFYISGGDRRTGEWDGVGRTYHSDSAFHVGQRRRRVLLVEMWYRKPVPCKVLHCDPLASLGAEHVAKVMAIDGEVYRDDDPLHAWTQQRGHASVIDAIQMRVHCAIWASDALLQEMPSPYRHNRFPFSAVWGYRRDRDGMPYGPIRNMRDPQSDLNKRQSKALHILSTKGMIADEDAFEDWDEVEEEFARPDYILKKRRDRQVEIQQDTALAEEHVMLMEHDKRFLEMTSGVTEENLGKETNAKSGIAIEARQNQGSVTTATLFDNLRLAIQLQGEIQLSLVEQYMDRPKVIRLTGDRGENNFYQINYPNGDGLGGITNDITRSKADFVVGLQDYRDTVRRAMVEAMLNLIGQIGSVAPETAVALLDLVVDEMDLPNKDELVRRIRKITGQADPDNPQDIERQEQAQAAQAQKQAEAEKLAMDEQRAKVDKLEAEIAKLRQEIMEMATAPRAQMPSGSASSNPGTTQETKRNGVNNGRQE